MFNCKFCGCTDPDRIIKVYKFKRSDGNWFIVTECTVCGIRKQTKASQPEWDKFQSEDRTDRK